MSHEEPGKEYIPSPVDDPGAADEDFDNRHGHLMVTNPEAYLNLVTLRDRHPGKYREFLKMEKERFLNMHRFLKKRGPQDLLDYHGLVNLFNTDRRGYAIKIKTNPELVDESYQEDADDVIAEVFGFSAVDNSPKERNGSSLTPRQQEVQRRTRTSETAEVIAIVVIGLMVLAVSYMILPNMENHLSGMIHGFIIVLTIQLSISRIQYLQGRKKYHKMLDRMHEKRRLR